MRCFGLCCLKVGVEVCVQVFIFENNIREQNCFLSTVAQQGSRDVRGGARQMCAVEFLLVPGSLLHLSMVFLHPSVKVTPQHFLPTAKVQSERRCSRVRVDLPACVELLG